jgi:general secretion pathway protein K
MRRTERGVAIVMAMGVVSLAAIVATAILASQAAWARRVELSAQHAQALELLQAGGDWARAVLSDDRRSNSIDHPGEPWAMRLPPMPVENGELVGHIEDQQGLFNLNNVVTDGKLNTVQFARFQRLLSLLGLPVPLADALADWIDADDKPQPGHGAEDEYYLSLDPPYRPANRPLIDIDELALVRGFDASVRARLAPFVAALPGITPINVNTASPEVLATVVEGLELDAARLIVARRNVTYYRSNADFLAQLPKGAIAPDQDIRVGSDYFMATLRVNSGGAQVQGKALFARLEVARWPTVVWRKIQ